MNTHFRRIQVNLSDSPLALQQGIEQELAKLGHPLQWVVVDVDPRSQTVAVDALVIPQADWVRSLVASGLAGAIAV